MNYLLRILLLLIVLAPISAYAQTNEEKADLIQSNTHNRFISSDGSYYTDNNTDNNSTFHYWWNANGLATLTDGYVRTRSTIYTDRMATLIRGIKTNNFWTDGANYLNNFYDDMDWLTIACIQAYKLTGDNTYLNVINELWPDIKGGYNNGAMSWNKDCDPDCKNAIANTPVIIIACRLYKLQNNDSDLQLAKDLYTWSKANIIRSDGAVWDSPTEQSEGWLFSYNMGMWIGACLELYKVTKEQRYIDDAMLSINYVIRTRRSFGGVLYLDETNDGDGALFSGIFMRYLAEFIRESNISTEEKLFYTNLINYTADYVWDNAVNKSNYLIDRNWRNVAGNNVLYASQLSGLKLFEAAASLQKVHVFKDVDYEGRFAQFAIGEYRTSDMIIRGTEDNDLTSITIPPGYRVTLYDGDDFTGESRVLTSNTMWIGGDWNDRVSSMRVEFIGQKSIGSFYGDCNFNGFAGTISEEKSYVASDLLNLGVFDNEASSVQVMPGYELIVYEEDDFQGNSFTITNDRGCLVQDNFNDMISSVTLRARGVSGLDGNYYLKNRTSGFLLNVDGSNLEQSSQTELETERFIVEELENGVYTISVSSGQVVEIESASVANKINAKIGSVNNESNQQFIFVDQGDGYYQLVARHSGKILEIAEASTEDAANAQQFENNGQLNGDWELVPVVTSTNSIDNPQLSLAIYPNPAQNIITIEATFSLKGAQVLAYDVLGNVISLQQINSDGYDISTLAKGIYTVQVISNNETYTQSFVKE